MINLSKRMEAIAAMITEGNVLADVGTDHGYIPIYQVQQNKNPRAIAMDLREGPLERAKEHIKQCGLEAKIITRISDGVEALKTGEADSIVIAGMGGELVIHILSEGENVCQSVKELVLQPQSEIEEVRKFLRENKYRIVEEDMVFEDGKYYPMMRVIPDQNMIFSSDIGKKTDEPEKKLGDLYGSFLLEQGHPVLKQYLQYQEGQFREILNGLAKQAQSQKIVERTEEIQQKLAYNLAAQKYIL